MMLFFIGLFYPLLIFSETTSGEPNDFAETTLPASYFSCQGPRVSRTQGRPLTLESAGQHWQQTREFYRELFQRIESRAQSNLSLSRELRDCNNIPRTESVACNQPSGGMNRNSLENQEDSDQFKPLEYHIRRARMHLALAADTHHVSQLSQLNHLLDPHGYKSVSWSPLTAAERTAAQRHLNRYRTAFQELHNLTPEQMQEVQRPYNIREDLRNLGDVVTPTQRQQNHQRLQTDYIRQMRRLRERHLDHYRATVSQYPIINYLTSDDPSAAEIYSASLRMIENGEAELNQIRQIARAIPENSNYIPNRVRRLLDYNQIVEELLAERPEYCRVAIQEKQSQNRAQITRTVLMVSPILAASFMAPPLAAVAIGTMASSGFAYSSYHAFLNERQSAYSAPVNDGSLRSDQFSVDQAQTTYHQELRMIPVEGIVAGLMSGSRLLLRTSRTRTPNNGN